MSDTVSVEISLSIGLVGCTREITMKISRDDWEEMDDLEREQACRDYMLEHVIDWGYEVK